MLGVPSSGVDRPLADDPPALGSAAWRPQTVAVAFVGALGLALAGRAAVSAADSAGALFVAAALVAASVATVGLALALANVRARPTGADFGLLRPRLGRALGLTLAVWVGLTATAVLWVSALGLDEDAAQALTDRLGTDGTLTVVTLIVVLTVLGPIQEEVLFRGYVFRALRNWAGVWRAAITTGVLFAATHVGWIPLAFMVPIVVSGVGLCLLYHWTGSLYPGIALHALSNSLPLGIALDWTWQIPLLMAGSTGAALTVTRLLALGLGDGQAVRTPPKPSVAKS